MNTIKTTSQEYYEAMQATITSIAFWLYLVGTVGLITIMTLLLDRLFATQDAAATAYVAQRTIIFLFLTTLAVVFFVYRVHSPIREERAETIVEITEKYEKLLETHKQAIEKHKQTLQAYEESESYVADLESVLKQNLETVEQMKSTYEKEIAALQKAKQDLEQRNSDLNSDISKLQDEIEQESKELKQKNEQLLTDLADCQKHNGILAAKNKKLQECEQFYFLVLLGIKAQDLKNPLQLKINGMCNKKTDEEKERILRTFEDGTKPKAPITIHV